MTETRLKRKAQRPAAYLAVAVLAALIMALGVAALWATLGG